MLDRYYWGSVTRISPEAPVPVVEIDSESSRLGGAANVANNIVALGGRPILIGVTGADSAGKLLRDLIREFGFDNAGVIEDSSRPTTVKTRVIAHHQHVVRIDQELKKGIDSTVQKRILDYLHRSIDEFDAIIFEDYNKGVVVKELILEVTELARRKKKIITVDPKFDNFFAYKNVTVFKPNRKETEEALGKRLDSLDVIELAGKELLNRLESEFVLITLGEKGMALFSRTAPVQYVANKARKVADVSGAGDTVISTLTMGLAGGASIEEAATLANFAAGIVCGEVGIVPIDKTTLYNTILKDGESDREG